VKTEHPQPEKGWIIKYKPIVWHCDVPTLWMILEVFPCKIKPDNDSKGCCRNYHFVAGKVLVIQEGAPSDGRLFEIYNRCVGSWALYEKVEDEEC